MKLWNAVIAVFLALTFAHPIAILAETPTAERPVWTEDSVWRYEGIGRGGSYYRTDRVEKVGESLKGQPQYLIRRGALNVYLDQDLNLVVVKDVRGTITNEVSPPLGYFNWPLKVGKRWSQNVTHYINGQTYRYEQDFKVLAFEKVKTPAGEFDAFKLSRAVIGGVTYEEYWYAPAAKNVVKAVGTSGTGGDFEHSLTSYELK